MSVQFTICNSCDHLMNHRLTKLCDECGSSDVYQDTEYEVEIDEELESDCE